MLPVPPDAVTIVPSVRPAPIDHRHSTMLSDCHRLASAADAPIPARTLMSPDPIPLVPILTHTIPVPSSPAVPPAGPFLLPPASPEIATESYDHPSLTLPVPPAPAVSTTRPDPSVPTATWHTTALSDLQIDASHDEAPTLAHAVLPTCPSPLPRTSTTLPPPPCLPPAPPGPFAPLTVLAPAPPYDAASDTDPPTAPILTSTVLLPPAPLADRHITLESATHTVDSHPLCPCRDPTLHVTHP